VTDSQPDDAPDMPSDEYESAQPERDPVDEDDDIDLPDADAGSGAPTGGGSRRMIVLIGSVLLLLAIGGGIAAAFVPGQKPSTASAPTSAPVGAPTGAPVGAPTGAAGDLPTSAVPTALPLPQAIGDVTSTEPVAQVGDATITRGDFVRAYQPGAPPKDILDQLIQIELVLQQAHADGFTVDQSKIDAQIAQIKQQNNITSDADFAALLKQSNIASVDQLRALIARDQIVEHMILTHTTVEQAHARHILLAATGDQVAARKAEAEDLLKQLQAGADFVKLASEKSEDPGSKDKGGDLGWASRGMFVTEFDQAIFSMKKDELRLVQSKFGWHIIQLLDLPQVRGLESSDMLNTAPGQQAFSETFMPWVKQLQTDAQAANKIKILVTDDQLVAQPGG
jgi:peptidyl-prolyl cis-trans isomerase C